MSDQHERDPGTEAREPERAPDERVPPDPNEPYGGIGRMGGYDNQPGPHAGRSPEGDQRSDERICEDVCEALARHNQIDTSEIAVSVQNGEVTLAGAVDSRQSGHLAAEIARQRAGVRDVHNQLNLSHDDTSAI